MRSDSSLKGDPDFIVLNKTLREVVIWSRFALRCSAKVAISLNSSVDGNSVEAVCAIKSVSHLTPRSSPPVIGGRSFTAAILKVIGAAVRCSGQYSDFIE